MRKTVKILVETDDDIFYKRVRVYNEFEHFGELFVVTRKQGSSHHSKAFCCTHVKTGRQVPTDTSRLDMIIEAAKRSMNKVGKKKVLESIMKHES